MSKIKLKKEDYMKLQETVVSLMELIDSFDIGAKDKDLLTVPVQMLSRYYRGEYYYNNEDIERLSNNEISFVYTYRQPKKLKKIQSFDDTDYIKKQKIAELKKKRRKENRIKRIMEEEQ